MEKQLNRAGSNLCHHCRAHLGASLCFMLTVFSQGIKANGFVFVSGCLGINPKSGDITGDVVAQTKQAMENMKAVLVAANSSFGQVVKTTILLADIKDFRQSHTDHPYQRLRWGLGKLSVHRWAQHVTQLTDSLSCCRLCSQGQRGVRSLSVTKSPVCSEP